MATFMPDTSVYMGTLSFDVATDTTRAGFAGDDTPRATFPSVVCTGFSGEDETQQDWGVLEEGDAHLAPQTLSRLDAHPLRRAHGEPLDEAVLRALLHHGLRRLGEDEWAEHPLLLSEPTGSSAAARRQLAELCFEDLGVPALCACHAAELICVSAGRPTATVVELNDDAATVSVVIDGGVSARAVLASPQLGGVHLARRFAEFVAPSTGPLVPACALRGVACGDAFHANRLAALRTQMCNTLCTAEEAALKAIVSKGRGRGRPIEMPVAPPPKEKPVFTLPDGRIVDVPDNSGSVACEVLFGAGGNAGGLAAGAAGALTQPLQALVVGAIASVEAELHKELLRSVVVTGNVACLPGVAERLQHELSHAAHACRTPSIAQIAHRLTIFVGTPNERKNGAWLGASILGSLPSHHELWTARAEYEEHGANIVNRKGMQFAW